MRRADEGNSCGQQFSSPAQICCKKKNENTALIRSQYMPFFLHFFFFTGPFSQPAYFCGLFSQWAFILGVLCSGFFYCFACFSLSGLFSWPSFFCGSFVLCGLLSQRVFFLSRLFIYSGLFSQSFFSLSFSFRYDLELLPIP